jgi:hypothetical protein
MTSSDAFVLLFLYSYQSQCDKFIDVNFPEFTNAFFNNLDLRDENLKDLVAPRVSNFLPPSNKSQPNEIQTPLHPVTAYSHSQIDSSIPSIPYLLPESLRFTSSAGSSTLTGRRKTFMPHLEYSKTSIPF